MDKLTYIKTLLKSISLSEGVTFEYDENAILEDYNALAENKSGLAIKILSILGGLLATLALVGFLAIVGLYYYKSEMPIFGVGLIIGALWINKTHHKLIIDTFSITIYITGLILFAFGLLHLTDSENIIAILIGLIGFCSLIVVQNFILSFISVLLINSVFLFLILYNNLYHLINLYIAVNTIIMVYFYLNEAKIIAHSYKLLKLYNPVRIGLTISLLMGLVATSKFMFFPVYQNFIWLSSVVIILAITYLVSTILKINEVTTFKPKAAIYIISFLILAPTLFSPSISGSILIILLGFLVNYKTGLTIGILSIIYFIAEYYYNLNFTLLTKSIILFVSGLMFIILYLLTIKNSTKNEKI